MISRWGKSFRKGLRIYLKKATSDKKEDTDLDKLYAKIGQLKNEKERQKKLKKLDM
jgi:hypothetical protein